MFLATLDRTIFSVSLVSIKEQLGLSAAQEASLLSAFLMGYSLTNLPGGGAADQIGGMKVLLCGLFFWSLAVAALPFSLNSQSPVTTMVTLRFVFGLFSGVAVPSAFTVIAEWLQYDERASGVGIVMAMFNIGSAMGFLLGALIPITGWPSLFHVGGIAGVAFSALGLASLKYQHSPEGPAPGSDSMSSLTAPIIRKAKSREQLRAFLSWQVAGQLACMIYVHVVINIAFFVFQNWLPKYMVVDLGLDISKSAYLTALPWAVLAACNMISGRTSDYMLGCGWHPLRVRQMMTGVSTLIPALCLIFLGLTKDAITASVLLIVALAAHGFNTAGYHSHVQDVAPQKAGLIIGLTNTVGVISGIGTQLITALLVEKFGSFRIVFNLTAMLYISAFACFCLFMQGGPLLGSQLAEKMQEQKPNTV
eukprot:gnl/MRDRNA2_/MRDRNA2_53129_c0_seq1.p1 gnl/MRDRNA2_/MRDRNA2_53129_c0~~gnl/MRDRNA2_/MRDRNA2_53129_c0_seq1.p1  ORF type:complete len:456 (-),score=71.88 gnl/MRDRNA2_/MRDRNA2_53129_c0_seq1:28-1290(-)